MPAWSVVKYFTHNPGVLDSSRTEFSGFFEGVLSFGKDTPEPNTSTGETQE